MGGTLNFAGAGEVTGAIGSINALSAMNFLGEAIYMGDNPPSDCVVGIAGNIQDENNFSGLSEGIP